MLELNGERQCKEVLRVRKEVKENGKVLLLSNTPLKLIVSTNTAKCFETPDSVKRIGFDCCPFQFSLMLALAARESASHCGFTSGELVLIAHLYKPVLPILWRGLN
jgi:hypothetical protein